MNLKKFLASIIAIIMLTVLVGLQSVSYAATLEEGKEKYMGIIELMTKNTPNMGYSINKPGETNAAKIWNIVKYNSKTADEYIDTNMYCLKAGIGFTEAEDITTARSPYDVFYDMKKERDLIEQQNAVLESLVNSNIVENGQTINCYNAVLAVLDMLYLPGETSDTETDDREQAEIINKIINLAMTDNDYVAYRNYIGLMQQPSKQLTKNDIVAVQQAVIWYFTNYYKADGTTHEVQYDKLNDSSWLNYKLQNTDYDTLANYTPNGEQPQYDAGQARTYQAEILYKYMIKTAKEKAADYANLTSTTEAPITVNKKALTSSISGDRAIIGPIHMTQVNATPYTIDLKVKNNGEEISYELVDKTEIPVGEDFYVSVAKEQANNITIDITVNYSDKTMTLWASHKNNQEQPLVEVHKKPESITTTLTLQPEEKIFDLALRKYITKINNGPELTGKDARVPNIDESTIVTGKTATYKHKKDPITIKKGDSVTYKITIYNEGEKAGRATEVVDQLPRGLKFTEIVSGNFELDSYTEGTNTLKLKRKADNTTNLPAYQAGNLVNNGIGSETIEIKCEVTAQPDEEKSKILTNIAWIAKEIDEDGNVITTEKGADIDSEPATTPECDQDSMANYKGNNNKDDLTDSNFYYKGQQDDDDFEKLILLPENFDLALRKFITAVNDDDSIAKRVTVDVSDLNKVDADGNMIATTAKYTENKPPVSVKKGDIVTYTLRVYNEGTINGYAQEITEDVPEGLQFLWSEKEGEELANDTTLTAEEKEAIEFNQKYLWGKFVYDESRENIIKISSDYLSKENETIVGGNLITAFGRNDGTKTENDLKYKDIAVKFKVVSEDTTGMIIRNEAAITEDCDEEGDPIDDRDSHTDEWKEHPNHEDDEDHDYITLKSFDLALRKFIVAVSKDTTIEENEYMKNEEGLYTRAPRVDTSKLNTIGEDGKLITTATYNHTKEPVLVQPNDIVVYMLRVYNEGDMDGYAAEIKDYLPPYLEYVDSEFNQQYGWSQSEDGRLVTTKYLSSDRYLINKAKTDENGKIVLSYQEVPIMCKVSSNPKTNENITNIAEISQYLDENKKPTTDRDSDDDNVKPNIPEDKDLPGYKDNETGEYIPGNEDDDDFEKVIVKIFDLALRKWVIQAIVIENGQETVIQTGHDAWDDPEDVVKVELHRKKINQVVVKFRYSIRVYNQGEIAGYAKEVTDYIPEGLRFVAEDNPGWTDEGNNVISTRLLENTLLQPGEYADVEVLLTWINNENNMGVMNNTAEISEDYNEYGVPDIDSTPDNQKPGEDDIDDAPVMLSLTTGQVRIYFTLGFVILITIAGGVLLIKKFVL